MEDDTSLREAVSLCRQGQWYPGLALLKEASERTDTLSGSIYSLLGYGIALCDGNTEKGLSYCGQALHMEPEEPEVYFNFARTLMLNNNRKEAYKVLKKGLNLDPNHPGMTALKQRMGRRSSPVFPFLDRNHPINVFFGKLRRKVR